ncbi:TPA: DUF4935 domain-containing protein [Serratia marcescens]|nr:DUF4935 domain-containing protein [Serratia marcescens]HEJ6963150.1 DUF4935 domain-containing protein [Serratia marcescens]HEJ7952965.1 DUF4935 domain-containing protein [Serratia marcescens]
MLETRLVFIDTQTFIKAGLHFEGIALRTFEELCDNGELQHISTEIVKAEVEKHLGDAIREALTALQRFKKKARILNSITDEGIRFLFNDLNEEEVNSKAMAIHGKYLGNCSTQYTDLDTVNSSTLMKLYFNNEPPFCGGKKKSEFPDAISLLSIKNHLAEHDKIYIISEDSDLVSFCEKETNFISLPNIDSLLVLYNSHEEDRIKGIREYFTKNQVNIKTKLKNYLNNVEVVNDSTWDDAEVDNSSIEIPSEIDPSIIYIDDEECRVTFDLDLLISVKVTGPDFVHGHWDNEDGVTYAFDTTTREEVEKITVSVEMYINYEIKNGNLSNIEIAHFDIPEVSNGISVNIEESPCEW